MHNLKKSLPIVANAYGESLGVNVVLGGSSSYTDGTTIHVPHPQEHAIAALWGLIAHEAAHVRFTDFAKVMEFINGNKVKKFLFNVVEDIRIEKKIVEVFPGVLKDLSATSQFMVAENQWGLPNKESHTIETVLMYTLFWGRVNCLKQSWLQEHLHAWAEALTQCIDSILIQQLNALLPKMANLVTNDDVIEMVSEIIAILEAEGKQQQSQVQPQAEGEQQQSQDQQQAEDDGQNQDQSPKLGDERGNNDNKLQSLDIGSLNADDVPECPCHKLKELLAKKHSAEITPSYSLQKGKCYTAEPKHVTMAKSMANQVKQALLPVLQGKANVRKSRCYNGNKLYKQKIYKFALGEPNIFLRHSPKVTNSAALHVTFDVSSSMGVLLSPTLNLAEATSIAAYAIYLATQDVKNVDATFSAFQGDDMIVEIDTKKSHGFFVEPKGYTPTGQALQHGLTKLARSKKERKVMLFITDGRPDNIIYYAKVAQSIEESTVALLGISLFPEGTEMSPRLGIKNEVLVNDIAQLPQVLTNLILKVLS